MKDNIKMVKVKELPEPASRVGILEDRLRRFIKMRTKVVKLEDYDCKNTIHLNRKAKELKLPVQACSRNKELYLVRTDMG